MLRSIRCPPPVSLPQGACLSRDIKHFFLTGQGCCLQPLMDTG
jgi:hypothetical protein